MNRTSGQWIAGAVGVLIGFAGGIGVGMFTSGGENTAANADGARSAGGVVDSNPTSPATAPRIEGATAHENPGDSSATRDPATARAPIESEVAAAGTGVVRGRIVDTEGKPLAGVVVRSSPIVDEEEAAVSIRGKKAPPVRSLDEEIAQTVAEYRRHMASSAEAVSNADGRYELRGVAAHNWLLAAMPGYSFDHLGGATARDGDTIDFVGSKLAAVEFAVLLPDGRTASRANLSISGESMEDVVVWRSSMGEGLQGTGTELWTSDSPTAMLKPGTYSVTARIVSAQLKANGIGEECASDEKTIEVAADRNEKVMLELAARAGIRGKMIPNAELLESQQIYVHCVALPASGVFDAAKISDDAPADQLRNGAEFEFLDLKPGKYAVAALAGWRSNALASTIVEVKSGIVTATLDLTTIDASSFIVATVTDALGTPAKATQFEFQMTSARSSGSSGCQYLARRDGSYWLLPGRDAANILSGKKTGSKLTLSVSTAALGSKQVEVAPGTRRIDVKFETPAFLDVTIAGYSGSGYEGKLQVTIEEARDGDRVYYTESYSSGTNDVKPDGTIRFGPKAPGDYVVHMSARQDEDGSSQSASLAEQKVTLVAGTNRVTLTIPSLNKLTVLVKGVEGGSVYLQSISGSVSESAEVADGKAEFANLAPGEYRVIYHDGSKMTSARVRIPDTTTLTITPTEPNALAITITDAKGSMAKAGFRDGDVIIGVDGKEFEAGGLAAFGVVMGKDKTKLLVLRDGKKVELEVGKDLFKNRETSGAELLPTSH